jgi:hypothetical protein
VQHCGGSHAPGNWFGFVFEETSNQTDHLWRDGKRQKSHEIAACRWVDG